MFKVDHSRASEIAEVLGKLGTEEFLDKLVTSDPQYRALERIYSSTGDAGLTACVAVANSLVSYQLSGRGEDYWCEVGNYFSRCRVYCVDEILDLFVVFLTRHTRYNRVQLKTKINRLRRFLGSALARKLYANPCRYSCTQYSLLEKLADTMDQEIYSKTIVFAVKMYYYVSHIVCSGSTPDPRVPVPVDRRIAYVSLASGLIRVLDNIGKKDLRSLAYRLMQKRYRRYVVNAWFTVSRESGIPCVLIDTIIWLLGRYIGLYRSVEDMVEAFTKDYGLLLPPELTREILTQLTHSLTTGST